MIEQEAVYMEDKPEKVNDVVRKYCFGASMIISAPKPNNQRAAEINITCHGPAR